MLIRRTQLEVFEAAATSNYIRFTVETCQDRLKSLTVGHTQDALRALVGKGLESARLHGIDTERSVWRYIHLAFECGDVATMKIDNAWAAPLLEATYMTGDQKMAALWQRYRSVRRAMRQERLQRDDHRE